MSRSLCRFLGCRCLILFSLCLGSLPAAMKEAFPGADDKWRRYQSPHFELFSRNDDFESRRLLRNLELLRALFLDRFKLVERKKLEVTVYYFSGERDFENYKSAEFRSNDRIGAWMQTDPDRNVLVMSPAPTLEAAQRLAFMGYVHHLLSTTGEQPPVWFESGLAELFGTLQVHDDELIFGRSDPARILELREADLLPLEALLRIDHSAGLFKSGKKSSLFYAQSWALLHYWYLGKNGLPRDGIDAFLNHVRQPEQRRAYDADRTREVFQQSLGMDYAAMNDRLERYVRSGRYSYSTLPVPKIDPPAGYLRRPVPREEIRERLAELALRVNRSSQAKLALLFALEKNPGNTRVMEALGTEALRDGDPDRAVERWEQALAAGSKNPALYDQLAQFVGRTCFQQFDLYYRLPEEKGAHLRDLLTRSIAEAPNQTEAYEMLAWVEAFAQKPSVANINLVQAKFPGLVNKPRTLLALAFVRLRLDDKPAAAELLAVLDKMQPDDWVAYGAEITRASLEGRLPDQSRPRPAPPAFRQEFKFPSVEGE